MVSNSPQAVWQAARPPDDKFQTVKGVAKSTYTDIGCGAPDTVVASVGSSQKSGIVTVATPQPVNIQFVGTTPNTLLAIRGTGGVGYSTTATVTFKVVDMALNGLANQTVNFGLTTIQGGIRLTMPPLRRWQHDFQADGLPTARSRSRSSQEPSHVGERAGLHWAPS